MTAKTLDDINGLEYDWLVCDKSGQVALFSTAGTGYAPNVFLVDTEAYDQAIEELLKLPTTTSAKIFPKIGGNLENTWKKASERGFFGYDADITSGDYNLVSIPELPIFINELPAKIAEVVNQFKFVDMLFNSTDIFTKFDISKNENQPIWTKSL